MGVTHVCDFNSGPGSDTCGECGAAVSSGRFGEILEHPQLLGLRYMVICPAYPDLKALILSECPRYVAGHVGKIVHIGAAGWLIIEPGIRP